MRLPKFKGRTYVVKLDGAVSVSVELPGLEPSVTDEGETTQLASGADPFTTQVKFSCPDNPFCGVNVKVSVVCAPVCSVMFVEAAARVKSGAGLNVAVTDWAEFMTRVQVLGSVPVQAPLHAEKMEPGEGVAVSDTDVPCG